MPDLREQLQQLFQSRVCLIGLGNTDYGDDGFGVKLAAGLKSEVRRPKSKRRRNFGPRTSDFGLQHRIILAGAAPERFLGPVTDTRFDHVLFLDAVEFGGVPGSVILLNSDETASRFPQISTHKLSLGLLAKLVEANGRTKVWLLGVQPGSLRPGKGLSRAVQTTFQLLLELIKDLAAVGRAGPCAPASWWNPASGKPAARRGLRAPPEIASPEVLA